ncbi:MAG: glycosyltransferase family 4 protein [Atopobiaceae bacterium]|nr:glycosyltransferase family 4 protein [Atopobiaceae bacterium]MBQ6524423.1 glycosyltransferase family 4 protein [Atopobiaceae bacterium]
MSSRYIIVSALYAPHKGGVETFTERLAHELAIGGDEVSVVTSRLSSESPEFETQDDGVKVWRLPCIPLMKGRLPVPKRNKNYRRLLDSITSSPADGILVNTRFYGLSLDGVCLAKRTDTPVIVLDHGASWLTLGNPVADMAVRLYERWATNRVKSYNPRFAGVSQKSVDWLKTFGITADVVIPNAIDAEWFRNASSGRNYREEFGLSDSQKIIAFVGRLEPEKGADLFARAIGELGQGYAGFLAGEGSLRRRISSMGLTNVHLLGNTSQADVSALLSEADAFCLPTESEGFCLAILEAASWGVPVAIPDVGIAREALGENFLLLRPPYDDLPDCIYRSLSVNGAAAQENVEKAFSWKNSATAMRAAFESIGH